MKHAIDQFINVCDMNGKDQNTVKLHVNNKMHKH